MTLAYQPRPVGWNTWDVRHHTGVAHLPTGLRLRFGLRSGDRRVADSFTWRHGLVRLGHHTVDGTYAQVTVRALDTTLDLQFAGGDGDELAATVSVDGPADLEVLVDKMAGVSENALTSRVVAHGAELSLGDRSWRIELSAAAKTGNGRPADGSSGALCLSVPAVDAAPLHVRLVPAEAAPGLAERRAASKVSAARGTALASRLRSGGWLADAADAYVRSVTWNTIYAPDRGRVLTPTSRDFVCAARGGFYGTWAIHTWDTFFTGLVASWIDPSYACGIFGQILDEADSRGMLPNRVSDDQGRTGDRSQPPVGTLAVLKAYLGTGLSDQTRDRTLLEQAYPTLRRWNDWWPVARRGPHGLLAWGSDPVDGDPDSATVDRTRRESGLDDSPMYDDVTIEPARHTMNLADVGLNALYVADGEALAVIADRLGERTDAASHRAGADVARAKVNRLLWDPDSEEYRNRWASGAFSEHVSPTMLYPLLAGVPTSEQARALVANLLSPDVLGGDPPLPSAARNDRSFSTRYWRGRVWAPMVYLAVTGLRRYGFDTEARRIVDALLQLFLDEWHRHSHVRENYPVRPGEDLRPLAARSDGLMSWGSLLAYLAFTELADPRIEGWRFAHPGTPAELVGLPLTEGRLAVRASDRLVVELDGAVLLDAPPHVVITAYARDTDMVSGVAMAHGSAGSFDVAPPGQGGRLARIEVPIPGRPISFRLIKEKVHS